MVSDSELISRLQEIIRSSDLDTTSAASVRRQLEIEFGVCLNDKKAFIREQINSFIKTHFSQNDNIDSQPQPQPQPPQEKCQGKEENTSDDGDKEVVGSEGMEVDGNDDNGSGKDDEEKQSDKESPNKNSEKVDKVVKRKGGGFAKLSALSPQLQELVGVPELARTEVVKKIWAYIKEKDLQIPSNKKKIKCDKILRGIFQVDTVDMFKMNKLLSKHIWPIEKDEHQGDEREEEKEESVSDNMEKQLKSAASEVEGNDDNGSGDDEEEDKEEEESEKEILKKNSECNKVVKRKGGFSKPSALSPQLQELVGVPELARTEVVRKIWAYIREKNLQDPNNKKKIKCDKILRAIFQVNTVDMFKMNQKLSKHIWPIEEDELPTPVKSSGTGKQKKQARQEGEDEPKVKEKRQKGQNSGFLAPLPLSDSLVKFLGTGEDSLSRSEVVKRMWQYIKENELQDPTDTRRILCDDKFKELFKVDSFIGFSITKLLTAHFIKRE